MVQPTQKNKQTDNSTFLQQGKVNLKFGCNSLKMNYIIFNKLIIKIIINNTIYLENIFKTLESIENNEYDIHTHMYSRCK